MKKLSSLFIAMLAVFTLTACNPAATEPAKDGDAMMEDTQEGDAMEEKDGEAMMEEKDGEAMEKES